jgi:hypothetical protein
MNREEQIRAKALEVAALIIGPLTNVNRIELLKPGSDAAETFKLLQHTPLADLVVKYLGGAFADRIQPTAAP